MRDYGWDYRGPEGRADWRRLPAYDMEFGNWGARSGLERGRWSGGGSYDGEFRGPHHAGGSEFHFPTNRPSGREHRSRFRGYDRGYRGAPDGGFGWGMTGLHEHIMRERGEGFGYAGDYHRTHPIGGGDEFGGRMSGGGRGGMRDHPKDRERGWR